MPDRSAENLRRLRAWDAEWDESKHNREDNGRFGIPRMRGGDPQIPWGFPRGPSVFPACAG